MVKRTVLEIYCLAVCFVVVICFAITLGKSAYDIIQITNPAFTLNSIEYVKFQSNDNFCNSVEMMSFHADNSESKCIGKSDAQITKMREAGYLTALQNEKRNGLQGLVISLIVLLINIIIFLPHWIIARNARAAEK